MHLKNGLSGDRITSVLFNAYFDLLSDPNHVLTHRPKARKSLCARVEPRMKIELSMLIRSLGMQKL